eukprot:TRINITY_DN17557_c0_g1_i1.p1 TRINITY_DN17557_c0_g1~~TRINITY_DN17557_c0_g1_i1.p1  ORF type:complete len:266 (-),score=46.82 TRINITY_DN17557_c0_g1_i1:89-886(-)
MATFSMGVAPAAFASPGHVRTPAGSTPRTLQRVLQQPPIGAPELVHLRQLRASRLEKGSPVGARPQGAVLASSVTMPPQPLRRATMPSPASYPCGAGGRSLFHEDSGGYAHGACRPQRAGGYVMARGERQATLEPKQLQRSQSQAVVQLEQRLSALSCADDVDAREWKTGSQSLIMSRSTTSVSRSNLDGLYTHMSMVYDAAKEECANLEALQRDHDDKVGRMQQEVSQWRDKSVDLWNQLAGLRSELSKHSRGTEVRQPVSPKA